MKKKTFWALGAPLAISGAIALAGCSHDMSEYEKQPYTVTDAERVTYAEKTLGVTIDPQQDWVLTSEYQVTVSVDANLENISQLAILNANPYLGANYQLRSVKVTNGATATLKFRAPLAADMLYVACFNQAGECIARPFTPGTDTKVSFRDEATATARLLAVTRSGETIVESPEYKHYYIKNFYDFQATVMNMLPEGKDNRDVIGSKDYTNLIQFRQYPYPILAAAFAFIAGDVGSNGSHLSYTVYPGGTTEGQETFIVNDNFDSSTISSYNAVTQKWTVNGMELVRRQDGELSTQFFSGDMLHLGIAKGSEVLADTPNPRVKVFMLNGYVFAACEDGDDWDYNDRVFWLSYGAEYIEKAKNAPVPPQPTEPQIWTYAWEDKDFGDYDMNDCVIEVQEHADDTSKIKVTLVALGATRSLWLGFENKSAQSYADYQPVISKELHAVLGVSPGTMVNTGRATVAPVVIYDDVKPAGFDFQTCSFVLGAKQEQQMIGVYDTDYYSISIATKGQDPHGIVIPEKWQRPQETVCIKDAYPDFNKWSADHTQGQDWYKNPVAGKVVTR